MATLVLTDAFVSIDGTDISDHVRQVSIEAEAELLEDTAMGDSYRSRKGGLKDWSVTLELNQDFAASDIDSILFPLLGSTAALVVRGKSDAVGTSNPEYSGTGILESYDPLSNSVGELATTNPTFQGAGALSRSTS